MRHWGEYRNEYGLRVVSAASNLRNEMGALLLFLILQLCDLTTTLVFLHQGVHEANPLIAGLLRAANHDSIAVLTFKVAACGLALYAWKTRRVRLVRWANLFFGICACWNLLAICLAPSIA